MVTAIDTNVLLDIFGADSSYGGQSKEALRSVIRQGSVLACEVVWAEVTAMFGTAEHAQRAFDTLGIHFSSINQKTALRAGELWKAYRMQGGARSRIVADFLIASHALTATDRLLTRDRGFYKQYFSELTILDPTTTRFS